MKRGLLLTLTEPPPAMQEEFNAWYDEEHLPERLAIPGFRSARRWVSGRSYLATYELDSLAVLSSGPYLARYENQTPWSRRCLAKCVVFKRWACEQVAPGAADPHPAACSSPWMTVRSTLCSNRCSNRERSSPNPENA